MLKQVWVLGVAATLLSNLVYAGADVAPIEPVYERHVEPSTVYVGLGAVRALYDDSCLGECGYEDVTYGTIVRAGIDVHENFGLEARWIATFLEADELGGQELQHIGIYAKPMVQLADTFNLYALLGYGWTTSSTNSEHLATVNDSGFGAGIGMEFNFAGEDEYHSDIPYDGEYSSTQSNQQGFGMFVDYQRLLIASDVPDIDVISAGLTYDF